jgi:hypothetical protein
MAAGEKVGLVSKASRKTPDKGQRAEDFFGHEKQTY